MCVQVLLNGGVSYIVDGTQPASAAGIKADLVVVAHSPNKEKYKDIMKQVGLSGNRPM